jgi:hypothetical protein
VIGRIVRFDPPVCVPTIVGGNIRRALVMAETLAVIKKALEKAGVEFTNGRKPGVRMK